MHASGARAVWLDQIVARIMDGGQNPPSIDRLCEIIPDRIATAIHDGHVTAANAFGEKRRDDFKAGQRVIIQELVECLRQQGFISGSDQALRWLKSLDGTWTVDVDGAKISIQGQRERRLERDRSMLGERDEKTGEQIGPAGIFASGRAQPIELEIVGPRGGTERHKFQVHPIALAIPRMTVTEREALRDSIQRHGVKIPIVIYEKKILDGVNRAYFAALFKRSVRIEEFVGSEDEAKRHVAALNLTRRHLNTAQRALAVERLFGKQAREQAAETQRQAGIKGNKSRSPVPLKTAEAGKPDRGGEWQEIAANMAQEAGIQTTGSALRAMREIVDHAPLTVEAIERGDIQTVAAAVKSAHEERGLTGFEQPFRGVHERSVTKHLGECIYHLTAIINDDEMPAGKPSLSDSLRERIDQIERLVPDVRLVLSKRRYI